MLPGFAGLAFFQPAIRASRRTSTHTYRQDIATAAVVILKRIEFEVFSEIGMTVIDAVFDIAHGFGSVADEIVALVKIALRIEHK